MPPRSRRNDKTEQDRKKRSGASRRVVAAKKKPARHKVKKKSADNAALVEPVWISVSVLEGSEIQIAKAVNKVQGVMEILLPQHDETPLYPGYVFVRCDVVSDETLVAICQVNNVEGVLARNGVWNYALGGHDAPIELGGDALASIQNSCTIFTKMVRGNMSKVTRGQRVMITAGTFESMSGTVVKVYRRQMYIIAKVNLSEGGLSRMVKVKHGEFESVEGDKDDGWKL